MSFRHSCRKVRWLLVATSMLRFYKTRQTPHRLISTLVAAEIYNASGSKWIESLHGVKVGDQYIKDVLIQAGLDVKMYVWSIRLGSVACIIRVHTVRESLLSVPLQSPRILRTCFCILPLEL